MKPSPRIVVVGASLAGVRAAEALRKQGFDGTLELVGAEPHFPPYDRPPLSKQVLRSMWSPDAARLRVPADLDVGLHLGRRAVALDAGASVVSLDDGALLSYDGLIVASGARPRRLPAFEGVAGAHVLRSLDDCLRLREEVARSRGVVVVGAGFIGAEVAASCRGLGVEVTVVDVFAAPMMRVLGAQMGAVMRDLHDRHGVTFALGSGVAEVLRVEGRFGGVLLDNGASIAGDAAVIAIGAAPETDWLAGSGLTIDDGVVCDEWCFAEGADNVVAAGDVARWRHPVFGEAIRVEHWTNAVAQAQCAARNLAARLSGADDLEPYAALPYYWSDQYDWKIQFIGRPGPEVSVMEGSVDGGRFMADYTSAGQLRGVLCVNMPARIPAARRRVLDAHAVARRR